MTAQQPNVVPIFSTPFCVAEVPGAQTLNPAAGALLAEELSGRNPAIAAGVDALALAQRRLLSHEDFKQLSKTARAVVRTGEHSPYANLILVAGVVF